MPRHLGTLAEVVPVRPAMASSPFTGTPVVYDHLGVLMGLVFSAS